MSSRLLVFTFTAAVATAAGALLYVLTKAPPSASKDAPLTKAPEVELRTVIQLFVDMNQAAAAVIKELSKIVSLF